MVTIYVGVYVTLHYTYSLLCQQIFTSINATKYTLYHQKHWLRVPRIWASSLKFSYSSLYGCCTKISFRQNFVNILIVSYPLQFKRHSLMTERRMDGRTDGQRVLMKSRWHPLGSKRVPKDEQWFSIISWLQWKRVKRWRKCIFYENIGYTGMDTGMFFLSFVLEL